MNNSLCIICEEKPAKYCIKGISKYCYCEQCAIDQFSELNLLEKI